MHKFKDFIKIIQKIIMVISTPISFTAQWNPANEAVKDALKAKACN